MEMHEVVEKRETEVRATGAAAFTQGAKINSCPHAAHTREAELWRRGFANAQFGAQME